MPYIDQKSRIQVDEEIDVLIEKIERDTSRMAKRDGILNYVITRLIDKLYRTSYTELNAAIGMLECAKLELYRRRLAPYEDEKIDQNGDVY